MSLVSRRANLCQGLGLNPGAYNSKEWVYLWPRALLGTKKTSLKQYKHVRRRREHFRRFETIGDALLLLVLREAVFLEKDKNLSIDNLVSNLSLIHI